MVDAARVAGLRPVCRNVSAALSALARAPPALRLANPDGLAVPHLWRHAGSSGLIRARDRRCFSIQSARDPGCPGPVRVDRAVGVGPLSWPQLGRPDFEQGAAEPVALAAGGGCGPELGLPALLFTEINRRERRDLVRWPKSARRGICNHGQTHDRPSRRRREAHA